MEVWKTIAGIDIDIESESECECSVEPEEEEEPFVKSAMFWQCQVFRFKVSAG